MNTFSEFEARCLDQNVKLSSLLAQVGNDADWLVKHKELPNGIYAAIAKAGDMLREEPDANLADSCIEMPVEQNDSGFSASNVLASIINASISPVAAPSPDRAFSCRDTRAIETCTSAEVRFGRAIAQMSQSTIPLYEHTNTFAGYQIITDLDDRPIAFGKASGTPSTLTLTDTNINNVPFPAGSILRAEIMDDFDHETQSYDTHIPPNRQSRIGVERVSHAAFMRISAYALPPDERKDTFKECFKVELGEHALAVQALGSMSIEEIRGVAAAAMTGLAALNDN